MGNVIDLRSRLNAPRHRTESQVRCAGCGERHQRVRLKDGQIDFPTAFEDGGHWFCRHRGCLAAWLDRMPPE